MRQTFELNCLTCVKEKTGSDNDNNEEIVTKKTALAHTYFLVGAFLEKRVECSHGVSSVFLYDTPEVTKIVLAVLQSFMVST